jgi:hypothetical protein
MRFGPARRDWSIARAGPFGALGNIPSKARRPPGVQSARELLCSSMRAFGRDSSTDLLESDEILHACKEDAEPSPHYKCQAFVTGQSPLWPGIFGMPLPESLGCPGSGFASFQEQRLQAVQHPRIALGQTAGDLVAKTKQALQ